MQEGVERLSSGHPSQVMEEVSLRTERQRLDFLTAVPSELAISILSHLSLHELSLCRLVSKPWQALADDEHLYKRLYLYTWKLLFLPKSEVRLPLCGLVKSWKDLCQLRAKTERLHFFVKARQRPTKALAAEDTEPSAAEEITEPAPFAVWQEEHNAALRAFFRQENNGEDQETTIAANTPSEEATVKIKVERPSSADDWLSWGCTLGVELAYYLQEDRKVKKKADEAVEPKAQFIGKLVNLLIIACEEYASAISAYNEQKLQCEKLKQEQQRQQLSNSKEENQKHGWMEDRKTTHEGKDEGDEEGRDDQEEQRYDAEANAAIHQPHAEEGENIINNDITSSREFSTSEDDAGNEEEDDGENGGSEEDEDEEDNPEDNNLDVFYYTMNNWAASLAEQARIIEGPTSDLLFAAAYQKFEQTLCIHKEFKYGNDLDLWWVLSEWAVTLRCHAVKKMSDVRARNLLRKVERETTESKGEESEGGEEKEEEEEEEEEEEPEKQGEQGETEEESDDDDEGVSYYDLFERSSQKCEEAYRLRPNDPQILSEWADGLSERANCKMKAWSRKNLFGEDGRLTIDEDSKQAAHQLFRQSYVKYERSLKLSCSVNEGGDIVLSNWGLALSDHAMIVEDPVEVDRLFALSYQKYDEAARMNSKNQLTQCNLAMTFVLHSAVISRFLSSSSSSSSFDVERKQQQTEMWKKAEEILLPQVDQKYKWAYFCMARLCSIKGEVEECRRWLERCNDKAYLAKKTKWFGIHFHNVKHLPWFCKMQRQQLRQKLQRKKGLNCPISAATAAIIPPPPSSQLSVYLSQLEAEASSYLGGGNTNFNG